MFVLLRLGQGFECHIFPIFLSSPLFPTSTKVYEFNNIFFSSVNKIIGHLITILGNLQNIVNIGEPL